MNKRKILSFEEANNVLVPYYDLIAQSMLDAERDYQKLFNYVIDTFGNLKLDKRTKACFIHDCIIHRIENNFSMDKFPNEVDVSAAKYNGIFALKNHFEFIQKSF